MTKKAFRPLLPHERVEQIRQTIARLPEAQQPIVLAEACDLLESPANTEPLPHRIVNIECLTAFAQPGSPIEERLQELWEKANIEYARRGKSQKQATQTSMNQWIREPKSQWAEPAARVYCIVTYGYPRDHIDRLKGWISRHISRSPSGPMPQQ